MASAQQALVMFGATAAIVSAQYWEVFVSGNSGSNVSIVELEFIDDLGGIISTAGGTASSSSDFSGAFLPAKAFDGLFTSTNRWASASLNNQELRMAFTGVVTPRQIKVYPFANAGAQADAPKEIQVRYSTVDPVTGPWTNVGPAYTGLTTGWVTHTARTFFVQ